MRSFVLIQIFDVNKQQQQLLDKIWQFDCSEELVKWICSLPNPVRKEATTLIDMITLATIDEEVSQSQNTQQAYEMIMKAVKE